MNKKRPLISLIAAIDKNNLIGDSGKIPWIIPGELKRFKEVTMGKPIVMGRKTHESIGRVLVGRENIVLSLNKPVHDLSRGCSVDDIISVSAIAAMQSIK